MRTPHDEALIDAMTRLSVAIGRIEQTRQTVTEAERTTHGLRRSLAERAEERETSVQRQSLEVAERNVQSAEQHLQLAKTRLEEVEELARELLTEVLTYYKVVGTPEEDR